MKLTEVKKLNKLLCELNHEYDIDLNMRPAGNGVYVIHDKSEVYTIGYTDTCNYNIKQVCDEFGFEFEPIKHDEIFDQIEKLVNTIDWLSPVELVVS